MSQQANATFAVKSWTETTWDGKPAAEVDGAKLSHAVVEYTYQGDIQGQSTIHYVMNYNADGSGQFVALEYFTGSIGGKSGSVVFQQVGTFEPVTATLSVLPGSGTGELAGLRGESHISIPGHMEQYPFTLNYHFEQPQEA
jgi:hypothetical protein